MLRFDLHNNNTILPEDRFYFYSIKTCFEWMNENNADFFFRGSAARV